MNSRLLEGGVLRRATVGDKAAILDLINLVQPDVPWTGEHFDWQLMQGPAGPAEVLLIECEGRVASLYVGTRKKLWIEGRVEPAFMVQDVLTHPDFRGRGMLNRLAVAFLDFIRNERAYGYTFPNKLSENSFRRSGWTELSRIPAIEKPLTAEPGQGPAPTALHVIESYAPETAEIWQRSGVKTGVMRDHAYLAWRYGRPRTTYMRFRADDDAGFLILKRYQRDDRVVMHICDLVVAETARRFLPGILHAVDELAAAQGVSLLTAWVPAGHAYRQAYAEAGYRPDTRNDRFVFVTGPEARQAAVAQAGDWHLSQGDSDVY